MHEFMLQEASEIIQRVLECNWSDEWKVYVDDETIIGTFYGNIRFRMVYDEENEVFCLEACDSIGIDILQDIFTALSNVTTD